MTRILELNSQMSVGDDLPGPSGALDWGPRHWDP